ncbi:MAG: hypothetical protein RBS77_06125 [Candidatus Moranbacteria bacterium]|jgi:hypothetical protein|nr:hypothetical protein [Candidatus Moranbacteria bacterium]
MDRKTFNRGTMDLLVGVVCGAIMHFSMMAYLIVFGIAVVVAIIIVATGGDASIYGNDEQGNFRGLVVLARVITVNVGVVIGRLALGMA